jgi:hypothetical protein
MNYDSLRKTIQDRINLSPETIRNIAELSGLIQFEQQLSEVLPKLAAEYVEDRLLQEVRLPPYPEAPQESLENDPYAKYRDPGWSPQQDHEELLKLIKRGRGKPAHDALQELHDRLAMFWEELPPNPGEKRRDKWYPVFDKTRSDRELNPPRRIKWQTCSGSWRKRSTERTPPSSAIPSALELKIARRIGNIFAP